MRNDRNGNPRQTRLRYLSTALILGSAICWQPPASIAGEHDSHMMHQHGDMAMDHSMMDHSAMDHSMHQMPAQKETVRTVATYDVPDVTLTGTGGDKVGLRAELAQGPVMVNFIFTTCTTICPAMTATFSEVQERLAKEGINPHLVSISIDPEQDTPARLKSYAAKFQAGPGWQFLTGSLSDSITVQRAFDAYRGDKMNHTALTLFRASPKSPWVRIEGFASAGDLIAEYRKAVSTLAEK